jgi:hypothetical protein
MIMTVFGVPLALARGGRVVTAGFSVGLALALDEVVYLIVTDGTNASYLLPVSFWSGAVMVGLACGCAALVGRRRR